ncbi:MAG: hypothetical protein EOR77_21470 [Mesorhizobium sp.]|uniref:DUF5983 family protein n=1 Tax=Mesorhizobium sp. TaxID=1871066 RepID=UPI000FE63EFC|nr:hypothetical protein [Mesorhizobium sp.]RWM32602.1 MAG: hypothetical protein EOR77_21470 [Mesorhizobium sp.]
MIIQMLELSTAHLSRQTADLIEMQTDDIPIFYEKLEYGWWFPVLECSSPHTIPEDLKQVLDFARSLNCQWVMFDRDADQHPSLPSYEW